MVKSFEAIINEQGEVKLLEPVRFQGSCRALVTVLAGERPKLIEDAMLSEVALGADWNREEEDEAWAHFQ